MSSTTRIAVWMAMVALVAALFGCASTVEINSEPEGAMVYIDGEEIDETPVVYTDTATILTTHDLRLEMEGYETVRTTLARDGDINTPALVGGIVGIAIWPLLASWLWVLDYPTYVEHELTPLNNDDVEATVRVDDDGDTITFVLQPVIDVGIDDKAYEFPAGEP